MKINKGFLIKICSALPLTSMVGFSFACAAEKTPAKTYQVNMVLKGSPSEISLSNNQFELFQDFETTIRNVEFSTQISLKVFVNNQQLILGEQYTYNDQTRILNVSHEALNNTNFTIEITVNKTIDVVPTYCLDIDYKTNQLLGFKKGAEVSSYSILMIPENIVTIGHEAFANQFSKTSLLRITTVIFNSKLNTIDDSAFYNCSALAGNLELPPHLHTVGVSAFEGCTGFTGQLNLPSQLAEIGNNAFFGTNFSGDLHLPKSLKALCSFAFGNCRHLNGNLSFGEIDKLDIFGDSVFVNCVNLKWDLSFPKENTSLPSGLFCGCKSLDSVIVIPENITIIESNVFRGCEKLQVVKYYENLHSIGKFAFNNCPNLESIQCLNGSQNNHLTDIDDCAFLNDKKFSGDLILPKIELIGDSAFEGCIGLDSPLILGSTISTIGNKAFYNCKNLKLINAFPATISSIGHQAFYGCENLTMSKEGINFRPTTDIKLIGNEAFKGCKNLNISIDLNNTSDTTFVLGDNVLEGSGITEFKFSNSILKVPKGMLKNCKSINTTIEINNTVTDIQESAFENCENAEIYLKHIVGPSSSQLKTIERYAFKNCKSVINTKNEELIHVLQFGNNLEEIGDEAFANCNLAGGKVTNLELPSSLRFVGHKAFSGMSGITTIQINVVVEGSTPKFNEWLDEKWLEANKPEMFSGLPAKGIIKFPSLSTEDQQKLGDAKLALLKKYGLLPNEWTYQHDI